MSDTSARQAFVRRQVESIQRRRETIARQMAELQADIDHWNRTHPNEEPIVLDADLTPDINAAIEASRIPGHLAWTASDIDKFVSEHSENA